MQFQEIAANKNKYWNKDYTTGCYLILSPVNWNRHRESGCSSQRMEALRLKAVAWSNRLTAFRSRN